MSQRKVIVEIETDGSTKIDAQGFKGQSCSLATRDLEMVLTGGDNSSVDDKKKPDFYATVGSTIKRTI